MLAFHVNSPLFFKKNSCTLNGLEPVINILIDNQETFEPFIEDEVPFDEYFQTMDNDGTWAGHMEVQAASLVTHSNVCIHRVSSR
jgi:OTU domain-containing protein 3